MQENHKAKLLDLMREVVKSMPGSADDFTKDIEFVLDQWDGARALLWFVWKEGTHLMALDKQDAPVERIHTHLREFEVFEEVCRVGGGAGVRLIEADSPGLPIHLSNPLEFEVARSALRGYYTINMSEPVSVHQSAAFG